MWISMIGIGIGTEVFFFDDCRLGMTDLVSTVVSDYGIKTGNSNGIIQENDSY